MCEGTRKHNSLRYYGTSRKVEVTGIFHLSNPSSRTIDIDLTHTLIETSTRKLPGWGGARPARKANNLTVICEPIV
jgi:hypothetical protein